MSRPGDLFEPPVPKPVTTRVGSAFSARLVALATVAALVGVALVGISGRSPETPSAAQAEPSASHQPPPTPTRVAASPMPIRFFEPNVPWGEDAFGVVAIIAERQYLVVLEEIEPDYLYGAFRLPFPRAAAAGTFELAQFWTRERRRNYVRLGTWDLPLDFLVPETSDVGTVVDLSVPARPRLLNVPRLTTRGYQLTVRAESRFEFGVLFFEVRVGPRRGLVGDDGIFGWPTTVNLPSPTPTS